jgi:hypothetical protein
MPEPIDLTADQIGQFVNSSSCPRRFRLELNQRRLAKESPAFMKAQAKPLDPVLGQKGVEREEMWAEQLQDQDFGQVGTGKSDVRPEDFFRALQGGVRKEAITLPGRSSSRGPKGHSD